MSFHFDHIPGLLLFLIAVIGIFVFINYLPIILGKILYDENSDKSMNRRSKTTPEQIDEVLNMKNNEEEKEKGRKHDGKASFYQKYW